MNRSAPRDGKLEGREDLGLGDPKWSDLSSGLNTSSTLTPTSSNIIVFSLVQPNTTLCNICPLHNCMCVHVSACACVYMWRPKVDTESIISTLLLLDRVLVVSWFSQGWPVCPQVTLSLPHSPGITDDVCHDAQLFMGMPGIPAQTFMFAGKKELSQQTQPLSHPFAKL